MVIEAYRKVEQATSSNMTLLVKKYEVIITNLYKMKNVNEPEYLVWRSNVINGLNDLYISLDFSKGELPELLGNLYAYMINAVIKDETGERADEVSALLKTLLEGWNEIR